VVAGSGALCLAWSAPLVRVAAADPTVTAFYRCALALPALCAARWFLNTKRASARQHSNAARLAGVFFAIDLACWHRAIDAVGAGLATVLGNLQLLFVAAAAWLLRGERPAPALQLAAPVLGVGIVLISGVGQHGAYGSDPAAGVLLGTAASLAYAAFILLLREASRGELGAVTGLLDATVTAASTLLLILVVTRTSLAVSATQASWLLLLAVSAQVVGWLLVADTLPDLPAAETSAVLLLQPAGAMLIGAVLFQESPDRFQVLGVVLVLLGVGYAVGARRPGKVLC
jgi:drug/metabolite transporter (DMT)-like permease